MNWFLFLAEAEGPPGFIQSAGMLIPMGIFFAIMLFVMGRSSARQRREQEALLANLKKNDRVITSSGIIGIISVINETEVTLRVDDTSNTRIRVLRSSITQVNPTEPSQSTQAQQTPAT